MTSRRATKFGVVGSVRGFSSLCRRIHEYFRKFVLW